MKKTLAITLASAVAVSTSAFAQEVKNTEAKVMPAYNAQVIEKKQDNIQVKQQEQNLQAEVKTELAK